MPKLSKPQLEARAKGGRSRSRKKIKALKLNAAKGRETIRLNRLKAKFADANLAQAKAEIAELKARLNTNPQLS
jgi:hypothetical protein